jgi:hypothetical protein
VLPQAKSKLEHRLARVKTHMLNRNCICGAAVFLPRFIVSSLASLLHSEVCDLKSLWRHLGVNTVSHRTSEASPREIRAPTASARHSGGEPFMFKMHSPRPCWEENASRRRT